MIFIEIKCFYRWETGNDIFAEEEGYLKNLGPDPDSEGENLNAQVQQGSYSYISPDGQNITVHYIADETGFHPTGDHLPTPPPVSPEVQKGLDLIYQGIRDQQVRYFEVKSDKRKILFLITDENNSFPRQKYCAYKDDHKLEMLFWNEVKCF